MLWFDSKYAPEIGNYPTFVSQWSIDQYTRLFTQSSSTQHRGVLRCPRLARLSACMLIPHVKGHTDTIQVYSVTAMTHVKALQAGHSSQGTSEPITPAHIYTMYMGYIYI